MRPQQKRQDVRPLELPDMSQEVNIVNAKFTETDPRFRDTDTNQLNKNSEGQISGVENSQAAADYKMSTVLRQSILEAGAELVKSETAKRTQKEKDDLEKKNGARIMNELQGKLIGIENLEEAGAVVEYIQSLQSDDADPKAKEEVRLAMDEFLVKYIEDTSDELTEEERKELMEILKARAFRQQGMR